jgi:lysophospholipid acyltransferase (LPLAT)-like uncharacterized protein
MDPREIAQKRLPDSTPGRLIIARIGAVFFKFIYLTARKKVTGLETLEALLAAPDPIILATWHNRCLLFVFGYLEHRPRNRELYLGVSGSRDGGLATGILARLGVKCIRGSASKGGTKALRQLVKTSRAGGDLAFVPDGPRGPVYVVKKGVIGAAKMTGAPILPITFDAKHKIRINSWDRLILPLPFTRVNYVYGSPLYVPRDCDDAGMDAKASELASELNRISELAGHFR